MSLLNSVTAALSFTNLFHIDLLTSTSRIHRPSLQGSVFWMAPEVVKQTSYTAKADIWSLGCLIVEMFTGQHPWMELTQMQAIFKIGSSKDARPKNPEHISADGKKFLDLTFHMLAETILSILMTTSDMFCFVTGTTMSDLQQPNFRSMPLLLRTWMNERFAHATSEASAAPCHVRLQSCIYEEGALG